MKIIREARKFELYKKKVFIIDVCLVLISTPTRGIVIRTEQTGLYLPGKPLTVLSPQISNSSPSIYIGQRWKWNCADAKIHCISSHLLFWDREGPRRISQSLDPKKPSKPNSHYPIIEFNT